MQVRKTNFLFLTGALSCVVLMLSGCLKDVQNDPPKPKAYFSFMHLAPKGPSVEIYFNSDKASNPFTSGSYTDRYNEVEPGAFSMTFKKAGGDSVVATIGANFYDSLNYYTILLFNRPDNSVGATSIRDDFSVLTQEKCYYRFWHMAPDIGDVDVYCNNELWESSRQFTDNIFASYFNEFNPKTSNSYTISVKKAGTDSLIAQTNTTLYNANAYTIFLKGIPNGSGNNTLGVSVLQASN